MGFHAYAIDRVEGEHEHLVGRRVTLLALARRRGFAVPAGFCVLKKTFHDLVRDTQLKLLFPPLMNRLIGRSASMEALAAQLREAILAVKIPPHILLDLHRGCEALGLGKRTAGRALTIRACPTDERLSGASLERAVAVTRVVDVEARLKQCWASVYDAPNLESIRMHGLSFEDAAPSVLVSETVAAEASGILFSQSPSNAGEILVEAVWGFHEALTEGKFKPSRYSASRARPSDVRGEEAEQTWEYTQGPGGALVRRELPQDRVGRPKLQHLHVEELLRASLELERLVGGPVAAEWSIHGGVIFFLQLVPLPPGGPPRGEAALAEAYLEAAKAEAPAAPRQPVATAAAEAAKVLTGEPPATAPPSRPFSPAPRAPTARGVPIIRTPLFLKLPPGAWAKDAAHIPHAGLVVDLGAWRRRGPAKPSTREYLGNLAAAVFPRPVLLELTDLDPSRAEAFHERAARGGAVALEELPALLGEAVADLAAIRGVADDIGSANLHLVVPFLKSTHDARLMRAALEVTGLGASSGLRPLVFSELRSPSTLLFNAAFADAQDGVLLRAGRFYKALVRELDRGAAAPGSAEEPASEATPGGADSFVQTLVRVTRALENAGGSVLVVLDDTADLDTLWFYHELAVDGFIAQLKDAEACTRTLSEREVYGAHGARKRGKLL